ncbi:MAG: DUF3488 domain-containing protein [Desulfuromonadales bacterium]|nr:DUF3488 domain-containing protein [Desulfuromonadales bacterium]MBN2793092.1 DUF3488 domain-containing protein [Desulfuromonadales bacterium]
MVGVERILQILAYLAALIAVLPLLPFISVWIPMIVVAAGCLGLRGDFQGRYLLGQRSATLLAMIFMLQFVAQASLSNLVVPLINLLCLFLALRLAGEKLPRHILQLFLLSTIILAASSMLSLNLSYLLYLILMIMLVTAGLVLLSFYTTDSRLKLSRREWGLLLKTIAVLPSVSLILMLFFFIILPRTQTPLWNFLNPQPVAQTGMSDQVKPGSVTDLATNEQPAFRVESEQLPDDALYWRGIVLNKLEGQTWRRSGAVSKEEMVPDEGSEIELTFYAEPKIDRFLVTLDRPIEVQGIHHSQAGDSVMESRLKTSQPLSYKVRAQYRGSSRQSGGEHRYLGVPDDLSGRLKAVAEKISEGENFSAKRALLDRFFQQQQLSYSPTRLPQTERALEAFLFESRRGYCEYFASSYALLLRMAGIPSRLVGGYLGGTYNQIGGYYLVNESAAHIWVEALDDDGVWRRIDPSRLAINSAEALNLNSRNRISVFTAVVDAALHSWSRLVLNYDLHQQIGVVRNLFGKARQLKEFDARAWQPSAWFLAGLLPLGAWWLWKRRAARHVRLINSFRALMAKRLEIQPIGAEIGLYELAQRSRNPLCRTFVSLYGAAVYQDRALNNAEYRQLRRILRDLKRQPQNKSGRSKKAIRLKA